MRLIYNNLIPVGGYAAINLCGITFVRRGAAVTPSLINHESIHTHQMRELLIIPFYLIYLIEWAVGLVRFRGDSSRAYMAISFEREAYCHDHDLKYLTARRPFAQWRRKTHN